MGPAGVEPLWRSRLRWRLSGASLWPAFLVLTPLEALVLVELPFYGRRGPGGYAGGFLVAGFANLFLVAAVTPLVARALRRRRRDLPRVVAQDLAGTRLLLAAALALVVAGVAHRPAVAEEQRDRVAQFAAVQRYVVRRAPEYRAGLPVADAMRIEPDVYRTCVPGPDPRRWLCLVVLTARHPPRVQLDLDRAPNDVYRMHGGFQ